MHGLLLPPGIKELKDVAMIELKINRKVLKLVLAR